MNIVIVSGADALAETIIEGLERAGAKVVRLVDDDVADTSNDLVQAGVDEATAVICAAENDAANLEIALLAKNLNPNVRVVARVANDVLRAAMSDDKGSGAILDVAELASPSIVEACLAQTTHPFEAAGIEFLVSGTEAPRQATWRELYGDLAPVVVIRGENSPAPGEVTVCPGRDVQVYAGDWTAMVGTPQELAAHGITMARASTKRSRQAVLRRVIDATRTLRYDMNPAFYPVVAAMSALVIGSTMVLRLNYQPPPAMSWVDALYFTAETMTTTGYGDFSFVHQPTWLRLFAAGLMFAGVMVTALLVAFIADLLLSRRFIYSAGRPRAQHLRKHVVVVGLGALGIRVVNDLTATGYDVAVIDIDQGNRFLSSASELDVPVIFGDATLPQTLESARVDRARAVAVMTRDEVVNIETGVVLAKMLGRRLSPKMRRPKVPLVLRIYDRALSVAVAERFGFVNARSTVELAAPWFISAALGLRVVGTFSVGQSYFVVGAMDIAARSALDGLRMADLSTQTRVIVISRPDSDLLLHPRRDARLRAGDTVYLVGPYHELLETLRNGQGPLETAEGDQDCAGHHAPQG